jgi:hypothetical protein
MVWSKRERRCLRLGSEQESKALKICSGENKGLRGRVGRVKK